MRSYARLLPTLLLAGIMMVGCLGMDSTTAPSDPPLRTLTLSKSGAGTGSIVATPAATAYAQGTTVSIAATADSGSAFTGWSGDGAGQANPCTIIMSRDRTVTAAFTASTGVGQFDGTYDGTWSGGQSDGSTLTGTFTWTVASGVIQGAFAPISGSTATMSGTASESGAISASIPAGSNGCSVNLTGQLATSSTGGITGATATGTYSLVASSTCNSASGTWSATRR